MNEENQSKAVQLMQIGFNVSIDASEYEGSMDEIIKTARIFSSTVVLRNVPDSMLTDKFLKKIKSHAHKIIIEV
jgi:hypothetical protein